MAQVSELGIVWAMFYSSILSMQFHPGAGSKGHVVLSPSDCALLADKALFEFSRRFVCHG